MRAKCVAVVLAAGQGKRMNSDVPKQYLCIKDKPVLYYSLKVFQESFVDEIILVTMESDITYCKREIVEKYGLNKVSRITTGGKERYHSVFAGIEAAGECEYIFIHDGARPFVTEVILERAYESVSKYDACVIGMPSKDTVKLADGNGFASMTPKRDLVWTVQTPQVFSYPLIKEAYENLIREEERLLVEGMKITDDAMVVETFTNTKVKLVEGSYDNIKITTPEDLKIAEAFLEKAGISR
ncbi:MAG: 2-C-methyl-D-erythritol 4-phosphate cytidylyltransferase [Clostridiales bacterium]|nr:2-C-methyl-D-erythritol 4-phosphate cytidylyltransferase [Clostridiales bacterium]